MSAETETKGQSLANSSLSLRPFAQRMSREHPELWEKFLRACQRERIDESGLTPAEFIRRATSAATITRIANSRRIHA